MPRRPRPSLSRVAHHAAEEDTCATSANLASTKIMTSIARCAPLGLLLLLQPVSTQSIGVGGCKTFNLTSSIDSTLTIRHFSTYFDTTECLRATVSTYDDLSDMWSTMCQADIRGGGGTNITLIPESSCIPHTLLPGETGTFRMEYASCSDNCTSACNCGPTMELPLGRLDEHYLYMDELCDADGTCVEDPVVDVIGIGRLLTNSSVPSSAPSASPSTFSLSAAPSVSSRPSHAPSDELGSSAPSADPSVSSMPSEAPSNATIIGVGSPLPSAAPSVSTAPSAQPSNATIVGVGSPMPSTSPSVTSMPSNAPSSTTIVGAGGPHTSSVPSVSAGPSASPIIEATNATEESAAPSFRPSSSSKPSSSPAATVLTVSDAPSGSPTTSSQPSAAPAAGAVDVSDAPSSLPSGAPVATAADVSEAPSSLPSAAPVTVAADVSEAPSSRPSISSKPSTSPVAIVYDVSEAPSTSPSTSSMPSSSPVASAVNATDAPSSSPSTAPVATVVTVSEDPSGSPTTSSIPSAAPVATITDASDAPSSSPSTTPSALPTLSSVPSGMPRAAPVAAVVDVSDAPSGSPSAAPVATIIDISDAPSSSPSSSVAADTDASGVPSSIPSSSPVATVADVSSSPSVSSSSSPTGAPSSLPSLSLEPTSTPSGSPSLSSAPTTEHSSGPSGSSAPSAAPITAISSQPSSTPVLAASESPSSQPTGAPVAAAIEFKLTPAPVVSQVTRSPASYPSSFPSHFPSSDPSSHPSSTPSAAPVPPPTAAAVPVGPTNAPITPWPTASPVTLAPTLALNPLCETTYDDLGNMLTCSAHSDCGGFGPSREGATCNSECKCECDATFCLSPPSGNDKDISCKFNCMCEEECDFEGTYSANKEGDRCGGNPDKQCTDCLGNAEACGPDTDCIESPDGSAAVCVGSGICTDYKDKMCDEAYTAVSGSQNNRSKCCPATSGCIKGAMGVVATSTCGAVCGTSCLTAQANPGNFGESPATMCTYGQRVQNMPYCPDVAAGADGQFSCTGGNDAEGDNSICCTHLSDTEMTPIEGTFHCHLDLSDPNKSYYGYASDPVCTDADSLTGVAGMQLPVCPTP